MEDKKRLACGQKRDKQWQKVISSAQPLFGRRNQRTCTIDPFRLFTGLRVMILHADNHRSQNTQYGKQWKNNPWPSWSLARRTNRAYQTFKQYTRSFPTRSQANISGWTRNTLSFERERLALSPRQATSIWRFMYVWTEGGLSDAAPLSLTDYSSGRADHQYGGNHARFPNLPKEMAKIRSFLIVRDLGG